MADNASTLQQVFSVPASFAKTALIDAAAYQEAYQQAVSNPDAYWAREAKRVAWMTFPTKIKNSDFSGEVSIKWFEDGVLNATVSCLDRHLADKADATAIIWEGDNPDSSAVR